MALSLPSSHPTLKRFAPSALATNIVVLAGIEEGATALIAELEAEGVHTWSAEHAAEALQVAGEVSPDVILLGEFLDADPSTVLEAFRRAAPEARVLFLLGNGNVRRAAFLLSLGVDDVLAPPHAARHILLRASLGPLLEERALARARGEGEMNGRADHLVVDRFSRMVTTQEDPAALTVREFELLERLLEAEGRVVSREALLTDIWGEEQDSEAVLDATVHRLRRKLENDHSSPRLLVTIRGVGYRLENSRVSIADR